MRTPELNVLTATNPLVIAHKAISATAHPDSAEVSRVFGIAGHAKKSLMCDFESNDYRTRMLASVLEQESAVAPFIDRPIFKIEVIDDDGITSLLAPVVRSRAMKKRAIELLKTELSVSGPHGRKADPIAFVSANLYVMRNHPSIPGGRAIVCVTRVLYFAEPGDTVASVRAKLANTRRVRNACGLAPIKVSGIASPPDWKACADWLVGVAQRPFKFRPGEITKLVRAKDHYDDAEAIRLSECLAMHQPSDLIAGIAAAARITRTYVSKLKSWQSSRISKISPLPAAYDQWASIAQIRDVLPDECAVPVRTDIPTEGRSNRKGGDVMKKRKPRRPFGRNPKPRRKNPET